MTKSMAKYKIAAYVQSVKWYSGNKGNQIT